MRASPCFDSPSFATGKRQRMRESNLWAVGPPDYFEEGSYLRVTDIDAELQKALGVQRDTPGDDPQPEP